MVTPFEQNLRLLAAKAVNESDLELGMQLADLFSLLFRGHYDGLQAMVDHLPPSFRARLGVVPTSREDDELRKFDNLGKN